MIKQDKDDSSSPSVISKIAPLATISRSLCDAVERHTFRSLTLKDDEDWNIFVRYMSHTARRRNLRSLDMMKPPGKPIGLGPDYWRSLASCLETVYVELDGWGEALALRILELCFPVHPVIAAARDKHRTKLRCGVPYVDLSQYFSEGFAIPTWNNIRELTIYGDNHRISLTFFTKMANACSSLISWRLYADEYERLNPKLVLRNRRGNAFSIFVLVII